MTVLLVLFTLILFLVLDHMVQKYRMRAAFAEGTETQAVRGHRSSIGFPDEVAIATNHTWMRKSADGAFTVGFDELLSRLVGTVDSVTLSSKSDAFVPTAEVAIEIGGRRLRLASPVSGSIVDTNADVLRNPSLLLSDPYGKGWLMKVRASTGEAEKAKQFIVRQPAEWLREQIALVRDFIVMNSNQPQPVMLQEGGLPVEGVLQQLDEEVWEKFGYSFATLHSVEQVERQEIQP
jgi:glycine cleavage system H protein